MWSRPSTPDTNTYCPLEVKQLSCFHSLYSLVWLLRLGCSPARIARSFGSFLSSVLAVLMVNNNSVILVREVTPAALPPAINRLSVNQEHNASLRTYESSPSLSAGLALMISVLSSCFASTCRSLYLLGMVSS